MKLLPIKVGLGAAFLLADAWSLQKYFFQVRRFLLGKKNSGKTMKILLLSDLHFKKRLWPFHKKLAREINNLDPDLVLVTGDLIDEHGTPGPAGQFFLCCGHLFVRW